MNYGLMKSGLAECSVDVALAAPRATVTEVGVRNYQALDLIRDAMRLGGGVLFYPSGCDQPGLVGIARVASTPCPGPTRFNAKSPYCDAKSKPLDPRWLRVDLKVLRKIRYLTFPGCVPMRTAGVGGATPAQPSVDRAGGGSALANHGQNTG